MKAMKKFFALLLALTMVLALSVPASAAKTAPVEDREHTYTAYKIFAGTQTTDVGDATLGSVVWGDGVDSEKFLKALKESSAFGTANPFAADTIKEAADVAAAMKDWTDGSEQAMAFAKLAEDYVVADKGITVANGQSTLDAGYYLIVDTTETVNPDDALNIALLQLTKKGTFEIAPKNSVPEVKKEVSDEGALKCTSEEEGHTHTKDCYKWADSNNVALGDTVHFKVESAVPATATEYEYYFFIINDTLSSGLTYTVNSLKVFIDGIPAATTDYTVKVIDQNIQVALVDAIANAGKSVVVTYDAVLNTGAIIGVEGNPNEVTVDYSNNPNEDFKPEDIPSDGFPKDETHKPAGVTPKDYTITYISKINVYKVDENKKPLQGAEFTLYGDTLNQVLVMKEQFTQAEDGAYWKLKNGTYTTEAPAADTYREATTEDGRDGGYVKVTDTYREATQEELNGTVQLYILVKGTADQYDSIETKYKSEWVSETKNASGEELNVVGTVDASGVVSFAGLPAGAYTLSETKVPAGYNPIDDIEFTITWTAPTTVTAGTEKCVWNVENNSSVAYNAAANAFEITIVNEKGTTLPETGGIGTTIFYALGGVLVAGAAILLITKKRMNNEA